MFKTSKLALAGVIAALYVALTLAVAPIGFGPVQFRVSEALTVLPFFYPPAVPGLFVGCLLSNFIGMSLGVTVIWDVVFGSLATLAAALLTSKMPIKWLAPLPPVLVNAAVIGPMLAFLYTDRAAWPVQIPFTALTVGLGELAVCVGLGLPLLLLIERVKPHLDKYVR